jgi:hypothetical protein
MKDPLEAIVRTIDACRTQVVEQGRRVARQRARTEELERAGYTSVAQSSRHLLQRMEEVLAQMQQELTEAQRRYDARTDEKPD